MVTPEERVPPQVRQIAGRMWGSQEESNQPKYVGTIKPGERLVDQKKIILNIIQTARYI